MSSNPTTASVFESLGKTKAHLVTVSYGEYYNLSADWACTWQVSNRPRWSEMIAMISWRGDNISNSALNPQKTAL